MLNYMADADYTIQLSDSEGFCYAVHESLSVGTPVIVTDIPIFKMIVNGYNGYRLPLDMSKIPIDEIINNIPKGFMYHTEQAALKNKWQNLIEGGYENA